MPARPPTQPSAASTPALVPQGAHVGKPAMPMGRPFTMIGARHRAHLHLLSRSVSKAHAVVINDNGNLYIRDTASREHVYVNGKLVLEADLKHGDLIKIGSFTFQLVDGSRRSGRLPRKAPPRAVVQSPDGFGITLEGKTLVMGRRATCDLVLPEMAVSNVHAIIFEYNGQYYIRDLGSRTGTHVNGEQIHQQSLKFDDQIRIGEHDLTFVPAEAPQEEIDELEHLIGTAPLVDEVFETPAAAAHDLDVTIEPLPIAEPAIAYPAPTITHPPIPSIEEEPALTASLGDLTRLDQEDTEPAAAGLGDTHTLPEEVPPAPQPPPALSSHVTDETDEVGVEADERRMLVGGDLHESRLSGSGSFANLRHVEDDTSAAGPAPLDIDDLGLDFQPEEPAIAPQAEAAHLPADIELELAPETPPAHETAFTTAAEIAVEQPALDAELAPPDLGDLGLDLQSEHPAAFETEAPHIPVESELELAPEIPHTHETAFATAAEIPTEHPASHATLAPPDLGDLGLDLQPEQPAAPEAEAPHIPVESEPELAPEVPHTHETAFTTAAEIPTELPAFDAELAPPDLGDLGFELQPEEPAAPEAEAPHIPIESELELAPEIPHTHETAFTTAAEIPGDQPALDAELAPPDLGDLGLDLQPVEPVALEAEAPHIPVESELELAPEIAQTHETAFATAAEIPAEQPASHATLAPPDLGDLGLDLQLEQPVAPEAETSHVAVESELELAPEIPPAEEHAFTTAAELPSEQPVPDIEPHATAAAPVVDTSLDDLDLIPLIADEVPLPPELSALHATTHEAAIAEPAHDEQIVYSAQVAATVTEPSLGTEAPPPQPSPGVSGEGEMQAPDTASAEDSAAIAPEEEMQAPAGASAENAAIAPEPAAVSAPLEAPTVEPEPSLLADFELESTPASLDLTGQSDDATAAVSQQESQISEQVLTPSFDEPPVAAHSSDQAVSETLHEELTAFEQEPSAALNESPAEIDSEIIPGSFHEESSPLLIEPLASDHQPVAADVEPVSEIVSVQEPAPLSSQFETVPPATEPLASATAFEGAVAHEEASAFTTIHPSAPEPASVLDESAAPVDQHAQSEAASSPPAPSDIAFAFAPPQSLDTDQHPAPAESHSESLLDFPIGDLVPPAFGGGVSPGNAAGALGLPPDITPATDLWLDEPIPAEQHSAASEPPAEIIAPTEATPESALGVMESTGEPLLDSHEDTAPAIDSLSDTRFHADVHDFTGSSTGPLVEQPLDENHLTAHDAISIEPEITIEPASDEAAPSHAEPAEIAEPHLTAPQHALTDVAPEHDVFAPEPHSESSPQHHEESSLLHDEFDLFSAPPIVTPDAAPEHDEITIEPESVATVHEPTVEPAPVGIELDPALTAPLDVIPPAAPDVVVADATSPAEPEMNLSPASELDFAPVVAEVSSAAEPAETMLPSVDDILATEGISTASTGDFLVDQAQAILEHEGLAPATDAHFASITSEPLLDEQQPAPAAAEAEAPALDETPAAHPMVQEWTPQAEEAIEAAANLDLTGAVPAEVADSKPVDLFAEDEDYGLIFDPPEAEQPASIDMAASLDDAAHAMASVESAPAGEVPDLFAEDAAAHGEAAAIPAENEFLNLAVTTPAGLMQGDEPAAQVVSPLETVPAALDDSEIAFTLPGDMELAPPLLDEEHALDLDALLAEPGAPSIEPPTTSAAASAIETPQAEPEESQFTGEFAALDALDKVIASIDTEPGAAESTDLADSEFRDLWPDDEIAAEASATPEPGAVASEIEAFAAPLPLDIPAAEADITEIAGLDLPPSIEPQEVAAAEPEASVAPSSLFDENESESAHVADLGPLDVEAAPVELPQSAEPGHLRAEVLPLDAIETAPESSGIEGLDFDSPALADVQDATASSAHDAPSDIFLPTALEAESHAAVPEETAPEPLALFELEPIAESQIETAPAEPEPALFEDAGDASIEALSEATLAPEAPSLDTLEEAAAADVSGPDALTFDPGFIAPLETAEPQEVAAQDAAEHAVVAHVGNAPEIAALDVTDQASVADVDDAPQMAAPDETDQASVAHVSDAAEVAALDETNQASFAHVGEAPESPETSPQAPATAEVTGSIASGPSSPQEIATQESAAPAPLPAAAQTPRGDPLLGMSRDFGSFLGGIPLAMPMSSFPPPAPPWPQPPAPVQNRPSPLVAPQSGVSLTTTSTATTHAANAPAAPQTQTLAPGTSASMPIAPAMPPISAPPGVTSAMSSSMRGSSFLPPQRRSIFGETPVSVLLQNHDASITPLRPVPVAQIPAAPVAPPSAPASEPPQAPVMEVASPPQMIAPRIVSESPATAPAKVVDESTTWSVPSRAGGASRIVPAAPSPATAEAPSAPIAPAEVDEQVTPALDEQAEALAPQTADEIEPAPAPFVDESELQPLDESSDLGLVLDEEPEQETPSFAPVRAASAAQRIAPAPVIAKVPAEQATAPADETVAPHDEARSTDEALAPSQPAASDDDLFLEEQPDALFDNAPEALDALTQPLEPISDITQAVGEQAPPVKPPAPKVVPPAPPPAAKAPLRQPPAMDRDIPAPKPRRATPPPPARTTGRRSASTPQEPMGLTGMGTPASDAPVDVFSHGNIGQDAAFGPIPEIPPSGFVPPAASARRTRPVGRPVPSRKPGEPMAPKVRKPAVVEPIEGEIDNDTAAPAPQDPGERKKKKKWKFPFFGLLGMALVAGGGGAGIWYSMPPKADVHAALRFEGLDKLSSGPRRDFEIEHQGKIATDEFRKSAQAIYENEMQGHPGDGFLYRQSDEDISFASIAQAGHAQGDRFVLELKGSHDRGGDRARFRAVLKALYVIDSAQALLQQRPLEKVQSALADAETHLTEIQKKIADGQKRQGDFEMARKNEKDLAVRSADMEKIWNMAMAMSHKLQSDLDGLLTKVGPQTQVEDDSKVKDLLARFKQLNDTLAAARPAPAGVSGGSVLDLALAGLGQQIDSTRQALNGGANLSAYLSVAQQARTAMQQSAEDLASRQKSARQALADLKRSLNEKQDAHIKKLCMADATLTKLEQDRAVQEHRLGAAMGAGLTDDAEQIRTQVEKLKKSIDLRHGEIAATDASTDEIRAIQKLIDDQNEQIRTDAARSDQRLTEQLTLISAAAPKAESLPEDQAQQLALLDQKVTAVNDARQQIARSGPAAPRVDVKALEAQIASLDSQLDARRTELAAAARNAPSGVDAATLAQKRMELDDAQKTETRAMTEWTASKKDLIDAQARLDALQSSQPDLVRDNAELELVQTRRDDLKRQSERLASTIIPIPQDPALPQSAGLIEASHAADFRPAALGALGVFFAFGAGWLLSRAMRAPQPDLIPRRYRDMLPPVPARRRPLTAA